MFYTEVVGKLFCTPCNVVLEHERKSTINRHFESGGRHSTVPSLSMESAAQSTICEDWVHTCTAVNMPLSKRDHPSMRQFLKEKVINGGAVPGYHQLQEKYLGDVYLKQCSTTQSSLASEVHAVLLS
uniref:Uncharacterized protein n=1 Tax=Hucho hucho TaxID=62062 RepID=A0A4W5Q3N7_9TELE